MGIKFKKKPYHFDDNGGKQHHFARAYISDFEKSYNMLRVLDNKGWLTNADIPVVFATTRAENRREHFIELWKSGFNIGFIPFGARSYGYTSIGSTKSLTLEEVKEKTEHIRFQHPYTLFFLDVIKEFKNGITEKDFALKMFSVESNGMVDQVHPSLDDLSRWGLIKKDNNGRSISQKGIDILSNTNHKLHFICYKTHLNENKVNGRILWSLLRLIEKHKNIPTYPNLLDQNPPFSVLIDDVIKKYNSAGLGKRDKLYDSKQIIDLLNDLEIDFSIEKESMIIIKERIFFSVTPAFYIGCGLSQLDNIEQYRNLQEQKDGLINIKKTTNYYFITDRDISLPKNIQLIKFTELSSISNLLETLPNAIFIDNNFPTAPLESISGFLHSYVRAGGILFISPNSVGRTGTNRQFFNWMPSDFERLNFIKSMNKWSFDLIKNVLKPPIYCNAFNPATILENPESMFIAEYGLGKFIFISDIIDESVINKLILNHCLEKNIVPVNKKIFKYSWIPQVYKNVEKEENIYPKLGKNILQNILGFTLSKTFSYCWEGKGSIKSYVDLFSVFPFITLWEVDGLKRGSKNSRFKDMSGESSAIDQGHYNKTPDYLNRAENQFNYLLEILSNFSENQSVQLLEKYVIKKIDELDKSQNFQIKEIFDVFYIEYRKKTSEFHLNQFIEFIKFQHRSILHTPLACLIGVSYGFAEGIKESAREHSIREKKYTLMTYRDLYEFLVRTEELEISKRREKLIDILLMKDGPSYVHISKI